MPAGQNIKLGEGENQDAKNCPSAATEMAYYLSVLDVDAVITDNPD